MGLLVFRSWMVGLGIFGVLVRVGGGLGVFFQFFDESLSDGGSG